MGTEKERERYVYLAKLSEQAERYDGAFRMPPSCVCVCVCVCVCMCAFVYLSVSVIAIALFVIQFSFAIRVSLVTACLYVGLLDCIIMFGVFGDVRCDSFGFFHGA
jgi:hypothetical protein